MSALALLGTLRLPESSVRSPGRIDLGGVALLSIGLTAPLLALSRTSTWGWGDARTLSLFVVGAAVLVGFVALFVPRLPAAPVTVAEEDAMSMGSTLLAH